MGGRTEFGRVAQPSEQPLIFLVNGGTDCCVGVGATVHCLLATSAHEARNSMLTKRPYSSVNSTLFVTTDRYCYGPMTLVP